MKLGTKKCSPQAGRTGLSRRAVLSGCGVNWRLALMLLASDRCCRRFLRVASSRLCGRTPAADLWHRRIYRTADAAPPFGSIVKRELRLERRDSVPLSPLHLTFDESE